MMHLEATREDAIMLALAEGFRVEADTLDHSGTSETSFIASKPGFTLRRLHRATVDARFAYQWRLV